MNYLSLHTKVRRLGYLKVLVNLYDDRDFIALNHFNQIFEKFASEKEILKQLEEYKNLYGKDNKGVIEYLGTGASAEPYSKLAEDLSIIAKSNYSYVLSKYGKVYRVISQRYKKERSKFRFVEEQRAYQSSLPLFNDDRANVFVLNTLDQFFFFRTLLERDFLYLKAILTLINKYNGVRSSGKVKYLPIKENLHFEIIKELQLIQLDSSVNFKEKAKAADLEKKITKKSLQIRSYESIVEPRVNWLLDLGFLDGRSFGQDVLKLSSIGQRAFEKLASITDKDVFLENEYVKFFIAIYGFSSVHDLQPEKKIEKYLNYAFINFKTLAPNRITASQTFLYISLMCFLRDGIVFEYSRIKDYVFSRDGKGYMIDWFPSENDGSIKKVNND